MTKKLMLGVALSALMLPGAFAQSPNSPSSAPPAATQSDQMKSDQMKSDQMNSEQAAPAKADQAKPMDKSAASQPADKADKKAAIVTSQKPDQWLASNFEGTDVIGDDGKKIGDVSDILFDHNGKIEAYVVSVGGFLGMGAKHVAIVPDSFTVQTGSNGKPDKLKLSMTKKEIKQAQNFKPYKKPQPVTTGSGSSSPMSGNANPLVGGSPRH